MKRLLTLFIGLLALAGCASDQVSSQVSSAPVHLRTHAEFLAEIAAAEARSKPTPAPYYRRESTEDRILDKLEEINNNLEDIRVNQE